MIAIYGGSFDPIHIGHLRLAEDVREEFNFRQVIFVPAYISPFKEGYFASPEDRINMIKLAIKYNPYFSFDDFEIKKGGKSYTIDTIRYFKEKFENLFFIVGTDAFLFLHKWKDYEELINLTNFVVLLRGNDSKELVKNYIETNFPKNKNSFYIFQSRKIDISSTEIRKKIKEGRSIKYLVLPEVEEYIKEKKLYL